MPEIKELAIQQPLSHIVMPVNVDNVHYGLFILSLQNNKPVKGIYCEPFNYRVMTPLFFEEMGLDVTSETFDEEAAKEHLPRVIHSYYYQFLTSSLGLEPRQLGCLFLGQKSSESFL